MKLLVNSRILESERKKLKFNSEDSKLKEIGLCTSHLKSEYAITLITLVIAIIILLILAGVVINLSIGENGLFNKAKKAREDYMVAANREQQELANIDLDKLVGQQTGTWKPEIVSAKDISNKTDKSKYYGATVTNYTCTNGNGVNAWRIFYADENNIYLIADDYIHYDYFPLQGSDKVIKYHYTDEIDPNYCLFFSYSVINNYAGSNSIQDKKIQALNQQYFDYLTSNNKVDTSGAIQAVASMLDTSLWNVFKGEKAEYAIGGPTIEMFLKSYNQTHAESNYITKVEMDNYGYIRYYISKDGGKNWDSYYDKMVDINDEKYGNLYTITAKNKAFAMWLASPASSEECYLAVVDHDVVGSDGNSYGDVGNDEAGFRPLVCLKSDVQLQSQEDGTYIIKQ